MFRIMVQWVHAWCYLETMSNDTSIHFYIMKYVHYNSKDYLNTIDWFSSKLLTRYLMLNDVGKWKRKIERRQLFLSMELFSGYPSVMAWSSSINTFKNAFQTFLKAKPRNSSNSCWNSWRRLHVLQECLQGIPKWNNSSSGVMWKISVTHGEMIRLDSTKVNPRLIYTANHFTRRIIPNFFFLFYSKILSIIIPVIFSIDFSWEFSRDSIIYQCCLYKYCFKTVIRVQIFSVI